MKSGVGSNSGVPPAPPPPPSAPAPCSSNHLRTYSSDTALTASSFSAASACTHPWSRESPAPPGCASHWPGNPAPSTGPSTFQYPSSPPPTVSSAAASARALVEEVVPGLRSVSAPPALRGGSGLRPVEVLPGQAVPRLELVEPRGKPLGATRYRTIKPLALRQPVLLGVRPPANWRASPLLLHGFPLQVGDRPWDRSLVASLLGRRLGPFARLLVLGDPFVGRAPPDLYGDVWLRPSQYRNMLPRLDGILLSWAGFIRCHPPDSCQRLTLYKECSWYRPQASVSENAGSDDPLASCSD